MINFKQLSENDEKLNLNNINSKLNDYISRAEILKKLTTKSPSKQNEPNQNSKSDAQVSFIFWINFYQIFEYIFSLII